MQIAHDHYNGKLTVTESSTPMRLLGAVFALAGLAALWLGPDDATGRAVFAAFIPVGIGMVVFAATRTVVCDPGSRMLRVTRRNLIGQRTERVGYAAVDAICFVREAGSGTATGSYTAGTFQLIARTAGGRRIDLSAAASWQRKAKEAAGAALADAIGTTFEY